MVTRYIGDAQWTALDADAKPTNAAVADTLTTLDTRRIFIHQGSAVWIEIGTGTGGGGGGGGGFAAGGSIAKSGDGTSTVISIAHGLSPTPDLYYALPLNAAARGIISYGIDGTNINLTYPIAPASGASNLSYVWGAGYVNPAAGPGATTGLSTDTKPVLPAGSRFFETDTGDSLFSDGTYWWLETAHNPFSPRRWGSMQWGASGTVGQGMLGTVVAATGAGTQSFATDNTNGRYFTHATGITAATKAGYRSNISTLLTRQFNPRMKFRFMLPAATDYALSRGYFGFTTNTEPTGDDALNARAGFMIGWISGGTNFIVLRNDGTGVTDVSGNVAGSAQALNTALHTVSIVADEPNTRFSVKWDANAYVHFTTEIPAATTAMTIFWHTETNEAAAKNFRMYNLHCECGR